MREQAQKYFIEKYQESLATPGNYRVDAFEQAREDLLRKFGDSYIVEYPTMEVREEEESE